MSKKYYYRLWSLVLPVLIESLLSMSVGWSDTILTARLLPDDKYLAAITIVSYIYWLVECFSYFASIGAQTLISQYTGAGKVIEANKTLQQSLLIAFITGLLLSVVVVNATNYLYMLTPVSTTQELVADYLRIISISYPFMMMLQVCCTAMQASARTLPAMGVMLLANVINIVCSWTLAVKFKETPLFSWNSIAAGTSISLIIACLVAIYCLRKGVGNLYLLYELPKLDLTQIRHILRIGIPGACNWILMTVGNLWHLTIISKLGNTAVAAHGVVVWCESLSWLISNAFSIAAATLIGQSLGANRPDTAKKYGWLALKVGVVVTSIMGVVFFTCSHVLMQMFLGIEHKEVFTQGQQVLQLIAFAQPISAAAIILTWGLEGGAGDTKFALMSNLACMLLVEIPLAYFLTGTWFNLGLFGAYLALLISHYIKGGIAIQRFSSNAWIKVQI